MTDLEKLKKKLYFRSGHRGTKEMDILLTKYANEHLWEMPKELVEIYEEFLKENDQDLYNWFLEKEETPDKYQILLK